MKKAWIICGFLMLAFSGCSDKKAENERLVLRELQKLESNTNTGLNYEQYSDRLLTATAEVDVTLKEKSDPGFAVRVREIQGGYQKAREVWSKSIHGDSDDRGQLRQIWAKASEQLDRLGEYVNSSPARRAALDEEDQNAAEREKAAAIHDAELRDRERKTEEKAREAQRQQAEQEAARKRQEAETAAAQAEHERRFSPEGTLFLLQPVTAHIKGGLTGLVPGTEVAVLRKNPDGTLHVKVKASGLETDLKPALATNDRDLAAGARRADEDEQAQASDSVSQMREEAAQRRRDEQIRAGEAMDGAARPRPKTDPTDE